MFLAAMKIMAKLKIIKYHGSLELALRAEATLSEKMIKVDSILQLHPRAHSRRDEVAMGLQVSMAYPILSLWRKMFLGAIDPRGNHRQTTPLWKTLRSHGLAQHLSKANPGAKVQTDRWRAAYLVTRPPKIE